MARLLARLRRRLPPACCRRRPAAHRLGRRGERVAARHLRRAGLRVLARRARTPHGEADLLVLDGRTLVVVEVKSASGGAARPSWARLGGRQARRLARIAGWLARQPSLGGRPVRVDLVAVTFARGRPVVTIRRHAVRRRQPSGDP